MTKKALLAGALALMSAMASAQDVKINNLTRKWAPAFDALVNGQAPTHSMIRGKVARSTSSTLTLMVTTEADAANAVAEAVKAAGYEAEAPTDQLVVATAPASYISTLAEVDGVVYIDRPTQMHTFMKNVRPETGVTKVQEGEGLDTPYDGSGVLIGVIDQGFEFKHPAFTGRVKRWGSSAVSGSTRTSAPSTDPNDQYGHATHVANIAMGNKITGSDYYGVATGAELMPMMSDLSSSAVVLQAKAIKDYADKQGMPWVLNMSFGSNIGPHDGTEALDLSMEKYCGKGAIMVAAMGNNGGDMLHATHTFSADGETAYFYPVPDSDNTTGAVVACLWANDNDGVSHLNIEPVFYQSGKIYVPSKAQMTQAGFDYETGIDPTNKRQYCNLAGVIADLAKRVIGSSASGYQFMLRATGEAGKTIHVWTDSDTYPCSFKRVSGTVSATGEKFTTIKGDDAYVVGEGGASVPSAIAVASYNASSSFTSKNGQSYSYYSVIGEGGDISLFSSKGPSLDLNHPDKPTIAAPGGCIISAFSKKASTFSTSSNTIVQEITSGGNKFYYGAMNGTSMATPVVTGIVALWLQANPELTPADVTNILKTTARHDSYAKDTNWNASWGYGKIDAYEGLKAAIKLRTAVNETMNTAAPITLQKGGDAWKVLFNNDESYAQIQVLALDGSTVWSRNVASPRHGDEEVVSLNTLTPGVYLIRIQTTASQITRKVVVK